mmetsp:Transcript_95518/g.269998  ORF Transcript_95518/g.269998 Transcript_95518/m.269998 type:complete len:118 (+) Transcript_95518:2186-2539(+)
MMILAQSHSNGEEVVWEHGILWGGRDGLPVLRFSHEEEYRRLTSSLAHSLCTTKRSVSRFSITGSENAVLVGELLRVSKEELNTEFLVVILISPTPSLPGALSGVMGHKLWLGSTWP